MKGQEESMGLVHLYMCLTMWWLVLHIWIEADCEQPITQFTLPHGLVDIWVYKESRLCWPCVRGEGFLPLCRFKDQGRQNISEYSPWTPIQSEISKTLDSRDVCIYRDRNVLGGYISLSEIITAQT